MEGLPWVGGNVVDEDREVLRLSSVGEEEGYLPLFLTFQTQLLPQMGRKKVDKMCQSSHPLGKNFLIEGANLA